MRFRTEAIVSGVKLTVEKIRIGKITAPKSQFDSVTYCEVKGAPRQSTRPPTQSDLLKKPQTEIKYHGCIKGQCSETSCLGILSCWE